MKTKSVLLPLTILVAFLANCASQTATPEPNPDVIGFFELAELSGEHTVNLPDGGNLTLSEDGQIYCSIGFDSCTDSMPVITALSTAGVLNLSWQIHSVQLQVTDGKVTATYCEVTPEKGCTQEDFTPIAFE